MVFERTNSFLSVFVLNVITREEDFIESKIGKICTDKTKRKTIKCRSEKMVKNILVT